MAEFSDVPCYSDRIGVALAFAADRHAFQRRKSTGAWYLTHLLSVAAAVIDAGGDEDLVIAALLHDVVEDTSVTVSEIRVLFGDRVADIVDACSDAAGPDKGDWWDRKRTHLAHLEHADTGVLVVTCADKAHNAAALADDLEIHGPAVWDSFKTGRDGSLWYYRSMLDVIVRRLGAAHVLVRRLAAAVDHLETVA